MSWCIWVGISIRDQCYLKFKADSWKMMILFQSFIWVSTGVQVENLSKLNINKNSPSWKCILPPDVKTWLQTTEAPKNILHGSHQIAKTGLSRSGELERKMAEALSFGSKQQHRSRVTITLLLLVRATYIYMAVVLRAHSARGESHIQRNGTW